MLLAYASAAAAAVGTAVSYVSAENNAKYQDKVNANNAEQINLEMDQSRGDQERAREQQHEQQTSEVNQYQAEAMRQRAQVEALLGEYGAGNSINRNLTTLGMRQGQDTATLQSNDQRQSSELGFQNAAQLSAIGSKMNSLSPGVRPSKVGLLASLGSTALTTAQRQQTINNPKPGSGVQ